MEKPHTAAVVAKLGEVPAKKLSTMVARTIWGLGFIAFGLAMGLGWIFKDVPVLVAFGTVIFGAVMASGQLTAHPFRLFLAFVRDLLNAWRGKNGNETPVP